MIWDPDGFWSGPGKHSSLRSRRRIEAIPRLRRNILIYPATIIPIEAGFIPTLALSGVGIGLIGSVLPTRFLSGMLYGVSAYDPLIPGAVATVLMVVAALACYIPASRAMSVDPIVALRYE